MLTYPVPCACGKTLDVPGTAAGSDVECACGLKVAVPSLARLKAAAGEESTTIEFQLQQLLTAGRLPIETSCSVCGAETNGTAIVEVVCERVTNEVEGNVGWGVFLGLLAAGIGALYAWMATRIVRAAAKTKELGRETRFRLPVRVCEGCGGTPHREMLQSVPLYARLLAKFPKAEVY